jgi:hypothetical protein
MEGKEPEQKKENIIKRGERVGVSPKPRVSRRMNVSCNIASSGTCGK